MGALCSGGTERYGAALHFLRPSQLTPLASYLKVFEDMLVERINDESDLS